MVLSWAGSIVGGEGEVVMPPLVKLEATEDNADDIICDARLLLYPIVGDLEKVWARLPVKFDTIQPEFGAEVRGMLHQVPKKTWEGAPDRRRATELRHWSSQNYHIHRQDQVMEGSSVMVRGYFFFGGGISENAPNLAFLR